jgi:Cu+-exporting ATPase
MTPKATEDRPEPPGAAEAEAEHPLVSAIVDGVTERRIAPLKATAFELVTSQGLRATVDGRVVLVGNARFLQASSIDPVALSKPQRRCRATERRPWWSPSTGLPPD